mgnify:CR=1 FL=1
MTQVQEVMTREVASIVAGDNLRRAAAMMAELDVGSLPVIDGGTLKGVARVLG